MMAHQMGTVLDRASGMLFPRRVESTIIHLFVLNQPFSPPISSSFTNIYPSFFATISNIC